MSRRSPPFGIADDIDSTLSSLQALCDSDVKLAAQLRCDDHPLRRHGENLCFHARVLSGRASEGYDSRHGPSYVNLYTA